jgi:hypothetical protein
MVHLPFAIAGVFSPPVWVNIRGLDKVTLHYNLLRYIEKNSDEKYMDNVEGWRTIDIWAAKLERTLTGKCDDPTNYLYRVIDIYSHPNRCEANKFIKKFGRDALNKILKETELDQEQGRKN